MGNSLTYVCIYCIIILLSVGDIMKERRRGNYKNSQEYIKLQGEITRLNNKLQELYEKKRRIKFYDEKSSKINKIFLAIIISFEILAIILSKGILLLIQSVVVGGLSAIGFDTSKKVYEEEKKLKAGNREIDIEIENTEAELKIARGNLDAYVKKQQKEMSEEESKSNVLSNSKEFNDINNKEESYTRVRTLGKNNENEE